MPNPTPGHRPATHADAEFAAAVSNAAEPHRPTLAGELLGLWINTEKTSNVRRFIVQEDGLDRGWISLVQRSDVGGGATHLNLLIPPAHKHLLPAATALAEDQGRQMGAPVLMCQIRDDQDHAIEWLRSAGWTQERRERFWRLDLVANASRISDLRGQAKRMRPAGVVITTAAELGGESFLPRLHEIDNATAADIPSTVERVPSSFQDWIIWMQPPDVLTERIWVAVVNGDTAGYSFLAFHPSIVETGYTGVLREYRGKGLARALKLETLFQAVELGVIAVETDNDSENGPILHLNELLGYQEIPGKLEFHRKLD